MPELPEVETTLRGLRPYLEDQTILQAEVRVPKLRTPIPADVPAKLTGQPVRNLRRRNKFILADVGPFVGDRAENTLLLHLGMSGRLSIIPTGTVPLEKQKHDHVILTTPLAEIRFNDARRFGLFEVFPSSQLTSHPWLASLGPEPLEDGFTGAILHAALQRTKKPVKAALMDNHNVVGVGNIYASESLFRSGINPNTPANQLSLTQCELLVSKIKHTLTDAIAAGGSSLRDFQHADGKLGYFQHTFNVYGRTGQPCLVCTTPVQNAVLAQRNTFWCATCQPPLLSKNRQKLK